MSSAQGPAGPPAGIPAGLARFNALPEDTAVAALHEVCASAAWVRALLDGRPYASVDALLDTQDAATAALTATDLAEATAGHPPIGRPVPGDAATAREQAGMAGAPARLREQVLDLDLAYREKFGHGFLICATGLAAEELRDALTARLGSSPDREREVVRAELGKINRIRLTRLAAAGEESA